MKQCKKVLCIILVSVILLGMIPVTSAAAAVTGQGGLDLVGAASISNDRAGWSWNAETKTLTLNNANIIVPAEEGSAYAVNLPAGSKVVFHGVNTIENRGCASDESGCMASSGLACEFTGIYNQTGTVTFEGDADAVLTIRSADEGELQETGFESYSVFCSMRLLSGRVEINGAGLAENSNGFSEAVSGNVDIRGGELYIGGKMLIGIYGNAKITGGSCTITGSDDACLIALTGDLNITGGLFTGYGLFGAVFGNVPADAVLYAGDSYETARFVYEYGGEKFLYAVVDAHFDSRNGVEVTESDYLQGPGDWVLPEIGITASFDGWYTGIDGTGTRLEGKPEGRVYYAKWTVNGKTVVTSPTDFQNDIPVTAPGSGITWNKEEKILTLSDAVIVVPEGENSRYALQLPGSSLINLEGRNYVVNAGSETNDSFVESDAIRANSSLTIEGSGVLNLFSGDVTAGGSCEAKSCGIYCTVLELNSGTVNVTAGSVQAQNAEAGSYGITYGKVTVRDGVLNAWAGGSVSQNGKAYSVGAKATVSVGGGRAGFTGAAAQGTGGAYSYGINGTAEMTAGELEAQGNRQALSGSLNAPYSEISAGENKRNAVAVDKYLNQKYLYAAPASGADSGHLHSYGNAVQENVRKADCTNSGSDDEVVYCPGCGAELSRVKKTIPATGHKYTAYRSNGNATSSSDGTKTAACDNGCGIEDTVTDEDSCRPVAKAELEGYMDLAAVDDNIKTEIEIAIEDGKAAIDAAGTPAEVGKALEGAKAAIDRIIDGYRNPFTDVAAGDWFYNYVMYVYQNKIMTGYSGGTKFGPGDVMDRAMFATVLYRIESPSAVTGGRDFPDVEPGSYYENAVKWASRDDVKVITGYGNGNFGPHDLITREQMALMMYRYAGHKGYVPEGHIPDPTEAQKCSDYANVSGFAQNAMAWAAENGIITGKGGKLLDPQGKATRSECAAVLMRFNEKYNT